MLFDFNCCWSVILYRFIMKMLIYVVCGILWLPLMQLNAAITLAGKQCGTKICHIMEFCSTFNNQCEHCDLVCNASAHNYDQVICTTQCQGETETQTIDWSSNFNFIFFHFLSLFRLSARITIWTNIEFCR